MSETAFLPLASGEGGGASVPRHGGRRGRRAAAAAAVVTAVEPRPVIALPDGLTVKWRDKGSSVRRRFNIHAYVGMNGSGKSLAMVHDTVPSLLAGRRVLSTVKLLDPATGGEHPLFERLTEWSQVLEAKHCDVLFDEVQGIADSRSSQGMPVQVRNFLGQLRRNDVVLRWTTPAWNWTDVRLRDVTRAVTVCRGYMPKADPGAESVWAPNRLFRWLTYDAAEFSRWTDGTEANLRGKLNVWYWRPSNAAQHFYSTLDPVTRIGEVLDSGRCAVCGGRRTIPLCSCDH